MGGSSSAPPRRGPRLAASFSSPLCSPSYELPPRPSVRMDRVVTKCPRSVPASPRKKEAWGRGGGAKGRQSGFTMSKQPKAPGLFLAPRWARDGAGLGGGAAGRRPGGPKPSRHTHTHTSVFAKQAAGPRSDFSCLGRAPPGELGPSGGGGGGRAGSVSASPAARGALPPARGSALRRARSGGRGESGFLLL